MNNNSTPLIGVIIVTYRSADVILPCLESLLESGYRGLKIAVCDNDSPDDTVEVIRDWAGKRPVSFREGAMHGDEPDCPDGLPDLMLVHTGHNRGYAGGVNVGLKLLREDPAVSLFWVLNPDCVVEQETPAAIARAAVANPGVGLISGRIKYAGEEDMLQSDGGRLNPWTGMCANIGRCLPAKQTPPPDPNDIHFVNGASLVASRRFLEAVGPMTEDYFLYYEEVDWSFRRGDLPIVYADGAVVRHHVGTSIGSATNQRRASAFANYFNYRNRIRFMRRFYPARLPVAYGYSALKVAALVAQGAWQEAQAAALGLFDRPPPSFVRQRLSPDAALLAFGRQRPRPTVAT